MRGTNLKSSDNPQVCQITSTKIKFINQSDSKNESWI